MDEPLQRRRAGADGAHAGTDGLDVRAALEAASDRYRELFLLAPVAYCVTDAAGRVREANRAFERLVGVGEATLAGTPLESYVARERRPDFLRHIRDARHGVDERWQLLLQPRNGDPVAVEATLARAQPRAGDEDLYWVLRELPPPQAATTARATGLDEQAPDEQTSGALLEAVLRQMPGGVVVVDPQRHVLVANDNARALLGDALEDGRPLSAALAGRAARPDGSPYPPAELPLARALEGGVATERELLQFDAGEGEPRTLEVAATLVRSGSGKPIAAVSVLTDVTERHRVDRAMREFVTNAAHELQTPIAAIVSAVDVLQAGAKRRARDRDRFLGHVEEQATRLTRLVRTLLVLARAQSGLEEAPVGTVRVLPLLQAVRREVHAPEQVAVEIDCPRELGVVANRDLAEQALLNLATNAARHTTRGAVRLVGRELAEGRVAIEVSDTGPGIPEPELERVFERFHRADRRGSGFGLGLAIVREVADALGSDVEVDSRPGAGTTVRLVLPGVRFASR